VEAGEGGRQRRGARGDADDRLRLRAAHGRVPEVASTGGGTGQCVDAGARRAIIWQWHRGHRRRRMMGAGWWRRNCGGGRATTVAI
jgi:hypothetical protein